MREVEERGEVELFWRAVFRDLYAWLASLVFHLVALILLAILMVDGLDDSKHTLRLTLSTRTGDLNRDGGRKRPPQDDRIEFEKPGEQDKNKDAPADKPQDPMAEEDPDKPSPDPGQKRGNDPNLPRRPAGSGTAAAVNPTLIAGRSSTARAELVHQEGGTSASEAAVARGLRWLVQHQNEDGSWSLDRFHKAGYCKGRCSHPGFTSDVAGTALALLPFLGAGQTHRQGQYQEGRREWPALADRAAKIQRRFAQPLPQLAHVCPWAGVDRAVRGVRADAGSLAARAGPEGDRLHRRCPAWRRRMAISTGRARRHERRRLAAHGAAQRADRLSRCPRTNASGRAMKYLDDAQTDSLGGRYAYMPGNRTDPVMTAEALLCRQYAGWPQDHPGLVDGVEFLLENHLPRPRDRLNIYYCYYATQVMHHMGGSSWERWNYRVRDLLVETQETKGHEAGSWTPQVGHDEAGGRLYQTALAVCTLEVYYRHLPLYRQFAVEK